MDTSEVAGAGRRAFTIGLAAAVSVSLAAAGLAWSPEASGAATGPEVTIVARFAPGSAHAASVAAAALGHRVRAEPADRYVAVVPASEAPADLARLRAQPGVAFAEVSHPVRAVGSVSPDDQCYVAGCDPNGAGTVNESYLQTIGAPQAWSISTGSGVTVAVLDSGVAPHPDLSGKIVRQTEVCTSSAYCGGLADQSGHGTHVTGILAADTNNTIGVAALGWNVKVDEYKVLDSRGNGDTSDVATAIYDAVGRGDRVINLSLANYSCPESNQLALNPPDCGPDPDEQAAVEYAVSHNVVVVAAAGNFDPSGDNLPTYPASYPGVLAVAATDASGVVAPFSQWGPAANIAAPGDEQNPSASHPYGVGIVSTWLGGGYAELAGTSMSTPQVSAAAALLISHEPSLSGPQVTELLESTAGPTRGGHPVNGGLLNVANALAASSRPPTSYLGYTMAGADGSVYSYGSVGNFGGLSGASLVKPVVGTALMPNGLGYWLVASDGGVFTFGAAGFHGSTGGVRLVKPIVGMASTPDGRGYWLVASDGGVFAFGDASFRGSTGGVRLAKPIVGMASTPDGKGYWMVASDGGVFAFGDARFYGSTGGVALARPVVGLARTSDGKGYWMVASDGGVFAFGDARFKGSTGGVALARPVTAMTPAPDSNGYWLVGSDGGVFSFGDARFYGSAGGGPIPAPVVSVAS